MGSRIVSSALKSRVDMGKDNKNVRELLLAAPDINADLFRAVIAPKLAPCKARARPSMRPHPTSR